MNDRRSRSMKKLQPVTYLLQEFDGTTGDREYEGRKGFMDRVKELFNG